MSSVEEFQRELVTGSDNKGTMRRMKSSIVVLMLLLWFQIGLSAPFTFHIPEEHVSTSLYGSVTLPCNFNFVQSLEGLSMIWEKGKEKKQKLYWILRGTEHLEEQDPRYRGRVKLSMKFPQGNLDLTLRDVTYEDEGTYYCRAANKDDQGDKKVILSIDGLDADDPIITQVTVDGKQRMKCMGSGVYHNPQVQWITAGGEDLSRYGRLRITEQSNGRKLVESVLDHSVEENVQVWCHILEGRLRKSAQFNVSDIEEEKESTALSTIKTVMATIPITLIITFTCFLIITYIQDLLGKKPIKNKPCKELGCSINEHKIEDELPVPARA